ncbi:Uncharacterised protein [Mycobacteroides abscessus]|nr:Uncharacterised protein [Mycobacteroides abscessus]
MVTGRSVDASRWAAASVRARRTYRAGVRPRCRTNRRVSWRWLTPAWAARAGSERSPSSRAATRSTTARTHASRT